MSQLDTIPYPIPHVMPIRKCSKCGIDLQPVMGYYCPQPVCPVGLGGYFTLTEKEVTL